MSGVAEIQEAMLVPFTYVVHSINYWIDPFDGGGGMGGSHLKKKTKKNHFNTLTLNPLYILADILLGSFPLQYFFTQLNLQYVFDLGSCFSFTYL